MRIAGIENPTLYENMEEYLLFEEDDVIELGKELACLMVGIFSVSEGYPDEQLAPKYLFMVERKKPEEVHPELDEAIRYFIIQEYGHRVDFSEGIPLYYR